MFLAYTSMLPSSMLLCGDHSDERVHEYVLQIHETVETINQLKTNREFFLSFARQPQEFLNNWLISQTRDLKVGPNEEVGGGGGGQKLNSAARVAAISLKQAVIRCIQ